MDGPVDSTWKYRADNSIEETTSGTSTREFEYDNAGLLTDDECNEYEYDDFDRVETVDTSGTTACGGDGHSTEYEYDGLDRQRSTTVSGSNKAGDPNTTTSSVYDGLGTALVGQTNAVTSSRSNPEVLYQLDVSGNAYALDQSSGGGGSSFLDTDGQGNVVTQVTTADDRACSAILDPFGEPTDTNGNDVCTSGTKGGSTGNTYWYRGQARDGSTGSYQLGARTYDPSSGTFSAPDSYRVSDSATDVSVGTDPLTANTYSYVNGNPVNLSDPSGHNPFCAPQASASLCRSKLPSTKDMQAGLDYKAKEAKKTARRIAKDEAEANKQLDQKMDWVGLALTLTGEVTGVADIKRCVMDGNITSCAMTVAGIAGAAVWKAGKFFKGVSRAIKSYRRFDAAMDSARATLRTVKSAKQALAAEMKSIAAGRKALKARKADEAAEVGAGARRSTRSVSSGGGGSSRTASASKVRESGPEGAVCRLANSFTSDTKVLMADGSRRAISKVRVGDRVLAGQEGTGRRAAKRVTHVWEHRDVVVELVLGGETIRTTDDHPFWSETDGRFEGAADLAVGELVRTADGDLLSVEGLDWASEHGAQAFNLTVEDFHTYYVGQASVWVHNCPPAAGNPGPLDSAARFRRALGDDYRGGPNPIGDGSALDAARHTITTGELVGGSTHLEKAVDMRNRYARILRRGGLEPADQAVAEARHEAYSAFVNENDLDAMMRARGRR